MNIRSRSTTRRLSLIAAVGLATTLAAGYAPSGATANTPPRPSACAWTAEELPRTPDAVEAWYRGCHTPRIGTPDALERRLG